MSIRLSESKSPCPPPANQPTLNASKPVSLLPTDSTPLVYNQDGTVAWDQMWDTFCKLASAAELSNGENRLNASLPEDPSHPAYRRVGDELIRGIQLVSGMEATYAKPGWLALECAHAAQARWMAQQIVHEHVQSYAEGDFIFVPITSAYTLSEEIKSLIFVIAKTSQGWQEHLHNEVKALMAWESQIVDTLRTLSSSEEQRTHTGPE